MKRLIRRGCVCCLGAMIVFPMASCIERGKTLQPENDNKKVTITFSSLETGTQTAQKMAELFMQKNPDIQVDTVILPPISDVVHDEYVNKLVSRDTSIDIFALDVIWIAEFASAGWLAPLGDSFLREEIGKLLSSSVDGAYYRGQLVALPWYADMGMLFYRKDLLDEISVDAPKTWGELEEQGKLLQDTGKVKYGYLFQGNKYEGLTLNYLEFLWSNGGELIDSGGRIALNSEASVEALSFMQRLLERGIAPQSVLQFKESQSRNLFLEGQSAFLRSGPIVWGLSKLEDSPVKGKIGIAPLPVGPNGDFNGAIASVGGSSIGINAYIDGPRKAAAIRFLKFLISPEAQKSIAIDHYRMPVDKKIYEDPDVLRFNPYYKEIVEIFERARSRPNVPQYSDISTVLQIGIHKALTNQSPPDQAIEAIESLLQEVSSAN
jgi:multiple sugar transport system substrate-binding protein